MRFTIAFHGPFAVSTGEAGRGCDNTVDSRCPLPGSSLKGVMRAGAGTIFPEHHVSAVFGTARSPSPWSWTSAVFARPPETRRRARVSIDPLTRTAKDKALTIAEEAWAETAAFEVLALSHVADPDGLHPLVLRAAAQAVHSLGMDRRRGLGWVTVLPERPLSDEDFTRIFDLGGIRA
ncbi:MAG: RAMP superfamily CRISPR-associated protein [Egibacteraceae bacterium]